MPTQKPSTVIKHKPKLTLIYIGKKLPVITGYIAGIIAIIIILYSSIMDAIDTDCQNTLKKLKQDALVNEVVIINKYLTDDFFLFNLLGLNNVNIIEYSRLELPFNPRSTLTEYITDADLSLFNNSVSEQAWILKNRAILIRPTPCSKLVNTGIYYLFSVISFGITLGLFIIHRKLY